MVRSKRRYGLGSFVFDLLLGVITCGIWWVYLIFRFFRNNS